MTDPIKISNSRNFQKYKEHLRKRESGGEVNSKTLSVFNRLGYLGLYQMGVKALVDAGMLNKKAIKQWNNRENLGLSQKDIISNNDNWTKGNSYDQFITDENLQEKALKNYTDKNYNAIKNTLKSKGIQGEDIFSYLTGAHLSGAGNIKKYINGGNKEWTDKNGTSIENYINSYRKYSNIKAPKSKELKNLTDAESYSAYSKFKKEVAKEDKILKEKGKDYQSTYTENVREIYKDFQNKYGSENLKKGAKLVSEENKYVFENDNYEFKRIKETDNKISKITKKYPNGKISDSDLEKIENLKKQKKAYYAKLRIKADEKKLVQMKKDMQEMDVNSDEYKLAVKSYDEIEKFKNNLKSNITNKSVISKKKYNDFESQKEEDIYGYNKDVSIYKGDYDPSDISDLYQVEEFKPLNFDEEEDNDNDNEGDNDYINYTPDEDDTKKNNSDYKFNFFEDESPRSTIYQDDIDNEEKQSVKGFLKDNPMAVLTAALGVKGALDSQSDIPDLSVKDKTSLSDSFLEHLNKLEKISKQGFTPEEEAAHLKKINDGYMASVDLAVQASGGNRANVLAKASQLNANKNNALLDFASMDAKIQRENLDKYGQALEYKESFSERKDLRRQTNEYRSKSAEFEQALQKRQGGAALAAGSIQSLINSIKSYKETGEGSALDRHLKYMRKKIEKEGTLINPETGEVFSNAEEENSYRRNQKELNSKLKSASSKFLLKFNSNSNLTKPEKDYIFEGINSLEKNQKLNFLETYDLKTGVDGFNRMNNPVDQSSLKDEIDFTPLEESINKGLNFDNNNNIT